VVPPRLTPALNKNPCVMQQGGKSQRHSFQVRRTTKGVRLYPCSITGAPELGYLPVGVRPFNSEVHSASALLPCFQTAVIPDRVLGSLEIALKRTRPRQHFYVIGRYSMTEK
jgi:hypothetical protein